MYDSKQSCEHIHNAGIAKDENNNVITFIDGCDLTSDAYAVRFSYNGKYIAVGDYSKKVSVYEFDQSTMLFDNTNLVFNSDAEFIVDTTFYGDCLVDGKGNRVFLNEDGLLKVASGSQLTLKNLELVGLEKSNMECLANDASLIIQNCKLTVTSDYTFDTGSILFKDDVVISGTNKFCFTSVIGSTIDSNSALYIDPGMTFSYSPQRANRDLLHMHDDTSWLYLDGCTLYSTKTGMRLTKGKLFIDNLVTLNSEGSAASEAICFGNGSANDDLSIHILAGAQLDVYGRLELQNTN